MPGDRRLGMVAIEVGRVEEVDGGLDRRKKGPVVERLWRSGPLDREYLRGLDDLTPGAVSRARTRS